MPLSVSRQIAAIVRSGTSAIIQDRNMKDNVASIESNRLCRCNIPHRSVSATTWRMVLNSEAANRLVFACAHSAEQTSFPMALCSRSAASSWIPELRCAPLSHRLVKPIPNGKSFRMALRSRSTLRASQNPFGKNLRTEA